MASKSGMQMLVSSMLPGVDFDEIVKAANAIGTKVQEMDARILRMESMLNEIMIQLTLITNNTLPADHAGESNEYLGIVLKRNGMGEMDA